MSSRHRLLLLLRKHPEYQVALAPYADLVDQVAEVARLRGSGRLPGRMVAR